MKKRWQKLLGNKQSHTADEIIAFMKDHELAATPWQERIIREWFK